MKIRKRNMVDTITMPDGAQVKTLEELREHFDLISVLEYYASGMLLKWLKSLHYEEEADAVAAMNPFMPEFEKTLCSLFQVPFSLEQMMAAYEEAARENCTEAQFRLGCCYLFGYGAVINRGPKGITKNHKKIVKGVDLTKQAAEQGHPFAQYSLGNYYRHVQGFDDTAAAWYQKAADQGYIEALYSLGTVESWLKAAERGHVRAQVRLGKSFFHGDGVEQDCQEAVKWYRKAAEQGDMEAEYRLSLCYLTGKGVKKDEEEAAKWCSRAGEKDTVPGEFLLGERYFYGCGIEQDFHEAAKWYHRAFVKDASWPIINKLDLCLAVMLGEKLVWKDTYRPTYFRGVAAQKYLDSHIEEYNADVEWIRYGRSNDGFYKWPFYPRPAMYDIPLAGPEDDVEALWCWRLAHRKGK